MSGLISSRDSNRQMAIKEGGRREMINEGVINNKRVVYNACAEGDLEKAKEEYSHSFKYIGSGTVTFHNGRKCDNKTPQHFFKLKKKK